MQETCQTIACFLDKHADGIGCAAIIIVFLLVELAETVSRNLRKK